MSLDHLCSIPGPISFGNVIGSALGAEVLLTTIHVSPTLCYSTGTPPAYFPTPLAGTAIPFSHWAGDITYRFEFVASVFNRATVLISYDPGYSTGAPTFKQCLTTLKNVTVNISGNTTIDFVVPWSQPMPAYRTANLYGISSASTSNGQVYMHLINPVQSNGSTDGIQYNVYAFSNNIALFNPRALNISSYIIQTELLSAPFDGEVAAAKVNDASTNFKDLEMRIFGDRCRSVKEVVSRMNGVYNVTLGTGVPVGEALQTVAPTNPFPHASVQPSGGATVNSFFSWFWFAYLGYRGGIRMSFRTIGTTSGIYTPGAQIVSHDIDSVTPSTFSQSIVPAVNAAWAQYTSEYAFTEPQYGITSRCDIVAPMMCAVDFVPREILSNATDVVYYNWVPLCDTTSGTDTSDYTSVLVGAADDVTFGWFLGYPPVK